MFREHEATRETPLIVLSTKEEPKIKAEAFALGANDYLVKLPDRLELLARIRYHSKGYINLLQRNEAYRALPGQPAASWPRTWPRRPSTSSRSCPSRCDGRDPGRLAVHPLGRPRGRLVRLPLARRRALRVLPARRLRPRRRRGPALGLRPERPPLAVAAADRLPRPGPGPHRPEPGLPDGPAERHVLHHLVRRLPQVDPPARLLRRRPPPGDPADRPLRRPRPARRSSSPQARWSGPSTTWNSRPRPARSSAFGQLFLYSDGIYEIERPDGSTWPLATSSSSWGSPPDG